MDYFVEIYDEFTALFGELESEQKETFINKGNDLLGDKDIGDTLASGSKDDVVIELTELNTPDLKTVMDFLVEEQAIDFGE